MHDVPAAGPETELDRGRVHDDPVADATGPVSCSSTYARSGPVTEIDLDPLQPGPLLEQPERPSRSGTTARVLQSEEISRSTRSSRALNGSLQSTVRWAWSLSFRWTQSTV